MDHKKCTEMENLGLVADSKEVRLMLVARLQSGECTLEAMQAELKKIKRTAHKKGLYLREDFAKRVIYDEQIMAFRRARHAHDQLNKSLSKKVENNKKIKI